MPKCKRLIIYCCIFLLLYEFNFNKFKNVLLHREIYLIHSVYYFLYLYTLYLLLYLLLYPWHFYIMLYLSFRSYDSTNEMTIIYTHG